MICWNCIVWYFLTMIGQYLFRHWLYLNMNSRIKITSKIRSYWYRHHTRDVRLICWHCKCWGQKLPCGRNPGRGMRRARSNSSWTRSSARVPATWHFLLSASQLSFNQTRLLYTWYIWKGSDFQCECSAVVRLQIGAPSQEILPIHSALLADCHFLAVCYYTLPSG